MRKFWSRIFLLCMACMICMSGLCLAKEEEEKENWVQYYYKDSNNIFYVDTNSIKVREYEGRKYLDVKVRAKGEQEEWYYIVTRTVEVTYAKWHKVFDIENRKVLNLEWDNKYSTPKKGTRDISELGERGWDLHKYLFDEQLVSWVEQNYPSVINEIRTHNQSIPGAKTDVMGTTGGSSGGSLQDIVGDIEYEVLDSGAVQFSPRCMAYTGPNDEEYFTLYASSYFIFAKPEKYSAWPGAYLVGELHGDYDDATTIETHTCAGIDAFDYDPKTKTFTFYEHWGWNGEVDDVFYRMQVIDKNTIYITYKSYEDSVKIRNNTYRYMPYDKLPVKSQIVDGVSVIVGEKWNYCDRNRCVWFGDHSPYFCPVDDVGRLNAVVDMARAFLAVNGQVGAAPEGYNIKTAVDP